MTAAFSAVSAGAVGLTGAIGVGLGAALAGGAIAVAAQSERVKSSFTGLADHVKAQLATLSTPVQNTLVDLSGQFRRTFDSLKPDIAGLFQSTAPLVKSLGGGLSDAAEQAVVGFGELAKTVRPLVDTFAGQLGPLTGDLLTALKNMVGPISANSQAFGQLLGAIGSALPALGSLFGTLAQAGAQILPELLPAIRDIAHAFGSSLKPVLPVLTKAVQEMLPPLSELASSFFEMAGPVLGALAPVLTDVVKTFADTLKPILPDIAKALKDVLPPLGELAKAFIEMAGPVIQKLAPLLTQIAGTLAQDLANALPELTPTLISLVENFGKLFDQVQPLIPQLLDLVNRALPPMTKGLELLVSGVGFVVLAFGKMKVGIAGAVEAVLVVFKGMVDGILTGVIKVLDAMGKLPFIGKQFRNASRDVQGWKDTFDTSMESAIHSANEMRTKVTYAVRNIHGKNVIVKVAADGTEQVIGDFNRVATRLATIPRTVTISAQVTGGAIGLLARRAAGGPVLPRQTYLVGEQGPELLTMGARGGMVTPLSQRTAPVVPLSASPGRAGAGGAGNTYVTVHVHGSVKTERDLVVAIRDGIARDARGNGGRSGL